MLLIETAELAKHLYEVWRAHEDRLHPITDDSARLNSDYRYVAPGWSRPRPKWEHLDTNQQAVWQAVADACTPWLTQ